MDDLRRARAVIRDEGRLRSALAAHEQRRFDVDSALIVKYRVEDLLETVSLVAKDDDFWDRLTTVDRPPSNEQLARVAEIDTLAFAALLEAAGYSSPPPPPADELVDDTINALIDAASVTNPAVAAERVTNARWYLTTLTMRVRKQISEQSVPELAPTVLRSSARSLGSAARWLIPRLVAGAAGAIVEAHAPGSGVGVLVGRSVQKVAEDLTQHVSGMVIGDPRHPPIEEQQNYDEPLWKDIDPLSVHIAALADQLETLRAVIWEKGAHADTRAFLAAEATRHLNRLDELTGDLGYKTDPSFGEKIAIIRQALDVGFAPGHGREIDLERICIKLDHAFMVADSLRLAFQHHPKP